VALSVKSPTYCTVCGKYEFSYHEVLWPELISDWEISSYEIDYINWQQGCICTFCGNNLRTMALADAILKRYGSNRVLNDFVTSDAFVDLKILEINEAGCITSVLSRMKNHMLIKYPEYDIENLPFESNVFDLVLHSDTLEHVNNPVQGLTECKRILKQGGACIYTVPIIVDRLSRTRHGLKASFHGNISSKESGLMVQTEFGSDFWKYPLLAGFSSVRVHAFEYPAALSIEIE